MKWLITMMTIIRHMWTTFDINLLDLCPAARCDAWILISAEMMRQQKRLL